MTDARLFVQANHFAFKAHDGQKRKGDIGLPYICHPLEVVNILAEAGFYEDYELLSAAVLHDVVEDCGVTLDTLEAEFGEGIARLVGEVTYPESFSKETKVSMASALSRRACLLKSADLISNLRALVEDPTAMTALAASRYGVYATEMYNAMQYTAAPLNVAFRNALIAFNNYYHPKQGA